MVERSLGVRRDWNGMGLVAGLGCFSEGGGLGFG